MPVVVGSAAACFFAAAPAAQEAETRYNLTGTPTFVINGVAQPSGGLTYEMLTQLLDQAAAH